MGYSYGTIWTDALCERLRTLWDDEHSASQIAAALNAEFGIGISRNAVIGKATRLALPIRKPRGNPRPRPRGPRKPRAYSRRQPGWSPPPRGEPQSYAEIVPVVDADIPLAQRKSLMELTTDTCRWPVGDPQSQDFFFCGAPPLPGQPYCAGHCARAYHPARKISARKQEKFARHVTYHEVAA